MNIELTKREQDFLIEFAKKQHDGAKDNVGTMTPIHVVERICTEYVESPDGDAWIWTDDYEYKAFDNFDDMVVYVREQTKGDYPEYGDIKYEDVEKDGEEIWVENEEGLLKHSLYTYHRLKEECAHTDFAELRANAPSDETIAILYPVSRLDISSGKIGLCCRRVYNCAFDWSYCIFDVCNRKS